MEATAKVKNKKVDKEKIISKYMTYVLEHEKVPASVYKFCKDNKIEESDFYHHFGSTESIQKAVWAAMFDQSIQVIGKSSEYDSFDKREKLLTFYYTLFEILTLNRSYILFSLTEHENAFSSLAQLSEIRKKFQKYISEMDDLMEAERLGVKRLATKTIEELGWAQFLVILRFWMKDNSPGFEKTDVMIEKTINSTFDLANIRHVRSIIDLTKFLTKETVGR